METDGRGTEEGTTELLKADGQAIRHSKPTGQGRQDRQSGIGRWHRQQDCEDDTDGWGAERQGGQAKGTQDR